MKNFNIEWNKVTWYSKLGAVILFIGVVPTITFYIGMQYEKTRAAIIKSGVQAPASHTSLLRNIDDSVPDALEIHYRLIKTENGKYEYPLVIEYPNQEIMKNVNNQLIERFDDWGCSSDIPEEYSDWHMIIIVDYAKNNIFSVNQHGGYYCGGPYPTNNSSDTLTFDMTTGDEIPFSKLFKDYAKDKNKIIATIYSNIIAETNKWIATHSEDDNSCGNVNTLENLTDYSHDYRISKNRSILVRPDYPHVIEACIEEVEVPIEKLLPFAKGNSILQRI